MNFKDSILGNLQVILAHFPYLKSIIEDLKANIFWMNLYQSMNILTSLLTSVAFARLSTQEIYSQYILILSIISLVSLIGMPGIRTMIFRSVSKGNDSFYFQASKFSLLWSLLGIPVLLIIGLFFVNNGSLAIGTSIMAASMFFPFSYSLQNWKNLLKAKDEFKNFFLRETSLLLTNATLLIFILFTDSKNLMALILVNFGSMALFNSYFFYRTLRKVKNVGEEVEWKKEAYEYTLNESTSKIFNNIDKILVAFLLPIGEVAIYNIAVKIVDTLFKFIKSSIEAILPEFFRGKYSLSNFKKIFGLLVVFSVIGSLSLEYPILWLYGQNYSGSIKFAEIYIFAAPFYFLSYLIAESLIKHQLSREVNIVRISSLIIYVILTFVLVPKFKLMGAIIASLLYYPLQIILGAYYLSKEGKV